MLKPFLFHISLLVASAFPFHVTAQLEPGESSVYKERYDYAVNTLIEEQRGLYNGNEYYPYPVLGGGHPFFISDKLQPERIKFNGIEYDDVFLTYDLFQETVVIDNNKGARICPIREKIVAFTCQGHLFRRIANHKGLNDGFYDILYDGATPLYARRTKSMRGFQWNEAVTYYIVRDEVITIKDKKSLLAVLADKEKEIRKFIKENRLTFRNEKAQSFSNILRHYDTLKQ
jgi:hypothetical protein